MNYLNSRYLINRYKHYGIEKLPEFEECEKLIKSDRIISKYINRRIGTSRGSKLIWTSGHIYHILEKLVQRYFYDQKDDPRLFNSLYHDFEKMCYEGFIPIRDIAPLHNFSVRDLKRQVSMTEIIIMGIDQFVFKPIQLEDNLRIKQITRGESRELFDLKEAESLTILEVGEPQFAIECDVNESMVVGRVEPYEKFDEKFQSEDSIDGVVTALRLFRSFFIGFSNIFPFKDLDVFVELRHKAKNIIFENQFEKPYALTHEELAEFQSFWKDFGSLLKEEKSNWKELSSAIEHFNSSYNRY